MVKEFVLPCLLLLMSCAGSKSEYCEPNFASQAQRWPLANEHGSYEFWRILEVLLVASNKFLRQPCGFQSEAQTDYATHDEADSRHYLGMRSFESYADKYPNTRSRVNCVMCGHPFHLYHISRCIEAHIWSRCEILLDLSFKSSKLRSTVAQFVNAILQKHCLQYHLLRFCLRCRLLGALKSPLS